MRIACFVSGGVFGLLPLQRLAAGHEIVLVARPAPPGILARRVARALKRLVTRPAPEPVSAWLETSGLPVVRVARGEATRLAGLLARARPDVICIATFPWLLPDAALRAARFGALNLHASLLPRHRGPNPWLWTYHAQDAEAGVTVHEAERRADAGPIHAQASRPLPRGYPITALHGELAELGATLLADAVTGIAAGTARPVAQDEASATSAPRVTAGTPLARFDAWDVGEVWHFLAGMHPQFVEPLREPNGRPVRYGGAPSFERGAAGRPGTLERTADGWRLHCRDGTVRLVPESRPR